MLNLRRHLANTVPLAIRKKNQFPPGHMQVTNAVNWKKKVYRRNKTIADQPVLVKLTPTDSYESMKAKWGDAKQEVWRNQTGRIYWNCDQKKTGGTYVAGLGQINVQHNRHLGFIGRIIYF